MSTTDARRWHNWRDITSADTAVVTGGLEAQDLAPQRSEQFSNGVITVKGFEEIVVRFFATAVADDINVADVHVFGWMENGPGETVYSGVIQAGTHIIGLSAATYLLDSRDDGAAAVYRECAASLVAADDAYGSTVSGESNLQTSHLLLKTGGYNHLQMVMSNFDADVPDRLRAIYRKLTLNQGR